MLPRTVVLAVAVLTACSAVCLADEPPVRDAPKFYRLDFAVKDVQSDRAVNTRNYSLLVGTDSRGHELLRTGDKLWIRSGGGLNSYDTGINIDCSFLHAVGDDLQLGVSASVTTLAGTETAADAATPPVLHQNTWDSMVVVKLRKTTTIFSSDYVSLKGKLQIDLTATPLP